MFKSKEKVQKLIAKLGFGSRRKIEKYIKNDCVRINNSIVKVGQKYALIDIVSLSINGKKMLLHKSGEKDRLLLYNKPEGEICSRYDSFNSSTVFNRLPVLKVGRWISVGRLDINSSGLLLFTNNGDLAHNLMHPKFKIKREYLVRVFGKVDEKKIKQLTNGIKIQGKYSKFNEIVFIKKKKICGLKYLYMREEIGRYGVFGMQLMYRLID